jgi:hypothetical protein
VGTVGLPDVGTALAQITGEAAMNHDDSLRYVATKDVDNVSDAAPVVLETADGSELGRLDGFMVDTGASTLRYYVVSRFGERSLQLGLVPFVPGCLDIEHGVLRLLDHAAAHPLH